ncbi:N5-glutamine methyltransferase family protein [Actinomadura madurae]|uniref:N5-glutamine methyltransferase family protein n=1 Tax=Actinomadura madurae TaxID=1993 RepID=UPI0020D25961|nr:class I SAM-dependent methyltransferase [Actinomadura madurae]MCP9952247.1 class I SAM-dependent methyltransferase [Actinomadura madurae]MCP9969012.1 class I SAM-dependent methyltransferase [Actinomadura madurae]MCP9981480.1 class I SAM-dependent methyltransferase [Actinomadura madurae]MCQ0007005.1 class I SAM-dependent methyltransferase [Actinomadura madurae]MCQ0017684.1 class I SAM-dependent methyltransferase [Actinomadura madurae]
MAQVDARRYGTAVDVISWREGGRDHRVRWRSESGAPPPGRVVVAGDETRADDAYRLACEGTALLWRGDFQNARQLLAAMARRIDRPPRRRRKKPEPSRAQAFHLHRQSRAQRARTLGMVLIPFDPGHVIPLRRAPDVQDACTEAYGPDDQPYVTSLRELLGLIGAHEWREKGVPIPALGGDRIHPHYGVFSPVRGEYVDLVGEAPLPATSTAFDVGTGTGVLAAVLARRGIGRVVATDQDPRALACARENLDRLKVDVRVVQTDLFPDGRAGLIVCNPPWVPAKPSSPLEHAVYDPGSRMLRGFLSGLAEHLEPGGEGWLILSDLAEHLGLRTRDDLLALFEASGLKVAGRLDTRPRHPRATDPDDPLHAARTAETTSLWRLTSR